MLIRIFFFNDTATTEIYTLSLHDALPISRHPVCDADGGVRGRSRVSCGPLRRGRWRRRGRPGAPCEDRAVGCGEEDRKSTRLNSSHTVISYAVFCLKKKKL